MTENDVSIRAQETGNKIHGNMVPGLRFAVLGSSWVKENSDAGQCKFTLDSYDPYKPNRRPFKPMPPFLQGEYDSEQLISIL